MTAYKKEVYSTILLTVLFLIAGHTGLFFVIFTPGGIDATFMGFPLHFIIPILMGWFGVLLVTFAAYYIGNHLDEEIARESEIEEQAVVADGGKPVSMG